MVRTSYENSVVYKEEKIIARNSVSLIMRCVYLLAVLLLLGVNGGSSIDKIPQKGDDVRDLPASGDEKLITIANDVALNTGQLVELEYTLNVVYQHFFGSPPVKLTLRSNDIAKTDFASTISVIGDTICNHVKNVFKKIGITSPSSGRSYNTKYGDVKSLKFSIYYQLMRLPLEITPLLQEIQNRMRRHMKKTNYVKMGYRQTNFSLNSYRNNSTNEWEIEIISDALSAYSGQLFICLEDNGTRSFDFHEALNTLTKVQPEVLRKMLKNRLNRRLPNYPPIRKSDYNELHAFVCHAIVENLRSDYRNCLAEIKRIGDCASAKLEESSAQSTDEHVRETSNIFIKSIESLDESCRPVTGEMGFSVDCRRTKKMASNNEFSDVVNFFMGDLKESPVLSRMTGDLGSMMKKSRTSADAVHEMATLIGIYQNGMEKKKNVLKSAHKDRTQLYNNISENLAEYKKHLASRMFKMMKRTNEVMSNVNMILVNSESKVVLDNVSANVGTVKCFTEVMEAIFGERVNEPSFPVTTISSRPSTDKNDFMSHSTTAGTRDLTTVKNDIEVMKNSHDVPLKKLMNSMKRFGQTSSPPRSSAIITLANTFLLATMFYECIAIIAAAIYPENSGSVSQSNSAERDIHLWPSMNKKSPGPTDHGDPPIQEEENAESRQKSISVHPGWLTSTEANAISTTKDPTHEINSQNNMIFSNPNGIQTITKHKTEISG